MNGVAAILLAAGRSSRMGRSKQLLPLGDSTVIGRCIDTLKAGGVELIVTVVSPEGAAVAGAAAVVAYALPLKLNIVFAIAVAVILCLTVERLRPQGKTA